MSPDRTDRELLTRLQSVVGGYDPAAEAAALSAAWDPATSIDKSLFTSLMRNPAFESMLRASPVKRRDRTRALDEIGTTSCSGYARGRYLLGSVTTRPAYSHSSRDSEQNARRIIQRAAHYEFTAVLGALSDSKAFIEDVTSKRSGSPLLQLMGENAGIIMFMTAFSFGISCALAEEQLFGPLA